MTTTRVMDYDALLHRLENWKHAAIRRDGSTLEVMRQAAVAIRALLAERDAVRAECDAVRAECTTLRSVLDGFSGPPPTSKQWAMICYKAAELRAALAREG